MGGLRFIFDSSTDTSTDPGTGEFRLNAPPSTQIAISETDADGNSVASWINSWDDSSAVVRARLFLQKQSNGSLFIYNILVSQTDNGGWVMQPVSEVLAGGFSNGDNVSIWIERVGDPGDTGDTGATGAAGRDTQGGRLTLDSTNPVPSAATNTNIHYLPFIHRFVRVKISGVWTSRDIGTGIVNTALPVPGAAIMYDIFLYDDSGTLTLEFLAWSTNTARATAIVRDSDESWWVKSGDASRLYLGSGYINTSGQINDQLTHRGLFNAYNRRPRAIYLAGPSSNWTNSSSTVVVYNGNSAPTIVVVAGLAEDELLLDIKVQANNASGSAGAISIGENSTSAGAAKSQSAFNLGNSVNTHLLARYAGQVPLGYNQFNWLESDSTNVGTVTFNASAVHGVASGGMTGSTWQ
jgi:hypothetical protein